MYDNIVFRTFVKITFCDKAFLIKAYHHHHHVPFFLEALKILAHPEYHLVDAYPTLCKVYAIAVAIPISSATAEHSFSALKRVKTRIRSTTLQRRLEALLLMAVEWQILHSLDKQCIIDMFAKTSKELTNALS